MTASCSPIVHLGIPTPIPSMVCGLALWEILNAEAGSLCHLLGRRNLLTHKRYLLPNMQKRNEICCCHFVPLPWHPQHGVCTTCPLSLLSLCQSPSAKVWTYPCSIACIVASPSPCLLVCFAITIHLTIGKETLTVGGSRRWSVVCKNVRSISWKYESKVQMCPLVNSFYTQLFMHPV